MIKEHANTLRTLDNKDLEEINNRITILENNLKICVQALDTAITGCLQIEKRVVELEDKVFFDF